MENGKVNVIKKAGIINKGNSNTFEVAVFERPMYQEKDHAGCIIDGSTLKVTSLNFDDVDTLYVIMCKVIDYACKSKTINRVIVPIYEEYCGDEVHYTFIQAFNAHILYENHNTILYEISTPSGHICDDLIAIETRPACDHIIISNPHIAKCDTDDYIEYESYCIGLDILSNNNSTITRIRIYCDIDKREYLYDYDNNRYMKIDLNQDDQFSDALEIIEYDKDYIYFIFDNIYKLAKFNNCDFISITADRELYEKYYVPESGILRKLFEMYNIEPMFDEEETESFIFTGEADEKVKI